MKESLPVDSNNQVIQVGDILESGITKTLIEIIEIRHKFNKVNYKRMDSPVIWSMQFKGLKPTFRIVQRKPEIQTLIQNCITLLNKL